MDCNSLAGILYEQGLFATTLNARVLKRNEESRRCHAFGKARFPQICI
jgi:hypothetical protein